MKGNQEPLNPPKNASEDSTVQIQGDWTVPHMHMTA